MAIQCDLNCREMALSQPLITAGWSKYMLIHKPDHMSYHKTAIKPDQMFLQSYKNTPYTHCILQNQHETVIKKEKIIHFEEFKNTFFYVGDTSFYGSAVCVFWTSVFITPNHKLF